MFTLMYFQYAIFILVYSKMKILFDLSFQNWNGRLQLNYKFYGGKLTKYKRYRSYRYIILKKDTGILCEM
jgi:hypothetical protein